MGTVSVLGRTSTVGAGDGAVAMTTSTGSGLDMDSASASLIFCAARWLAARGFGFSGATLESFAASLELFTGDAMSSFVLLADKGFLELTGADIRSLASRRLLASSFSVCPLGCSRGSSGRCSSSFDFEGWMGCLVILARSSPMLCFLFDPALTTIGSTGGKMGVSLGGCLASGLASSVLVAGSGRTMTFLSGFCVVRDTGAGATTGAGDGDFTGELFVAACGSVALRG